MNSLELADHVVDPLLEARIARCLPHEADGRQVVAGDVSGEVAVVAVPAAVGLRLRLEAGTLPIERQHPIGLEREEVRCVEILRALERSAGEAHRVQRQRARSVRHDVDDVLCARLGEGGAENRDGYDGACHQGE